MPTKPKPMKNRRAQPRPEPSPALDPYVPGALYCRVKTDAIRPHIGAEPFSFAAKVASRLPEAIAAPFDYLRRNHGLTVIQPLFAVQPGSGHTAPIDDRLALMASVANPVRERFGGYSTLQIDPKASIAAVLKKLASSQFIEFVEPAPARYTMAAQADPNVNLQWGLRAIKFFQVKRPDANRIRVAVIDTGIDERHPEFDAASIDYQPMGLSKMDIVGHGTHVCGIVAAIANNGKGIAGIANCKLSVWKVFPDKPDSLGRFVADPNRFLQALGAVLESGASVLNLSLGGPAKSQAEQDVIRELSNDGILTVAAMGNHFQTGNPTCFPAAYETTLAVGAVGVDLRRASFSCTGSHIGVCAPGVGILSTLPTTDSPYRKETDLGPMNGTSMAAPHVAACGALLAAGKDIKGPKAGAALIRTARRIPEMKAEQFTEEHGHGLIDLQAALA